MSYIINPRYYIDELGFFWKLFGLRWGVVFRYAIERENSTTRYATVHYENRGRFKTKELAEERLAELWENPEFTRR
jgi:hypothetical protein